MGGLPFCCFATTCVMCQYPAHLPSDSVVVDSDTFSGFVVVGSDATLGSGRSTVWTTTGIAMRKMMSNTSMTSTKGVVLMSDIGVSSPPSDPTLIAIDQIPNIAIFMGPVAQP